MQENHFFREPTTQRRLLDILFIYCKLNPDTGYRQGMHEILAPILWVVDLDAIDVSSTRGNRAVQGQDEDLMLATLNQEFVEHDTFALFCAVMQTVKSSYEIGEQGDSNPVVARSHHIQDVLLASVDPELSNYLRTVGVLPQVYLV